MDAPRQGEIPALDQVQLDMHVLGQMQDAEYLSALMPLAEAYEAWIITQEARLNPPTDDLLPYIQSARSSLDACRTALERIREGIRLVNSDPNAADAFRFANRAMSMQRIRTIYAREVRQASDGKVNLADFDIPKNRSWRPFQLAFILLNIPAGGPNPSGSHPPTAAIADLLWFPTGGGKTEAYLGVAAFTMGIRRLQGEMGGTPAMPA